MIAAYLLSTAALFIASTSAAFNGTITQSDQTIQDILSNNQSYSKFSQVLKNSKPLTPLFQEEGANYTVFAPSNKALSAIPPWILATVQESNALQTLLIAMHVSNETWSLPEGGAGGAAGGNQTTGTSEESTLQRRQEMGKQGNEQEQDQESQYEGGALPQPPQNKTRPTRPKARKERGRVILTSLLGTSITLSRRGQQVLINDMGAVDFVVKGTNGFVVGIDQVLGSEQEQQQQGAGPSQGEQQQL